MTDIVTNELYAEIDRLRARVKELEESRDSWKREWRLSNAGLDMAEKRIAELEAEWGGPRGDGITVNPEWGADTSSGGFDSHALPPSYKKGSPQWRPLLTHIDT